MSGRGSSGPGQRPNERVWLRRRDQPGPLTSALDPEQVVDAGDVEAHEAAARGPEIAEAAPHATSANAHAPADLLAQLPAIDTAGARDAVAGDAPAAQGPDHLDVGGADDEDGGPEPEPDPDVDE